MEKLNRVLHLSRSVIQFHSTITVDQLINVPLLNGRFKVKWKFNNPVITNPTTQHIINNQNKLSSSSPSSPTPSTSSSFSGHQPVQTQTSSAQLVELPIKSEPTGSTDYVPLKNHAVLFKHAFHCPISIELDRNGNPLPSILTIIIKEEHVNELGRRVVSRHGLVHIDLTQYAPIIKLSNLPQRSPFGLDTTTNSIHPSFQNSSRIEKAKFLLKECKTNAHLKIQVQMDYIGGLSPFNIPKSITPLLAINSNGTSSESPNPKGVSQQDDTRSTFNTRMTNTNSPGSSIISDGSSQHIALYRTRKQSLGTKSTKTKSSEVTGATKSLKLAADSSKRKNQPPSAGAMSSQLAQNVIDLIFSPYYPPSSPHPSFNLTSSSPSQPSPNHLPADCHGDEPVKRFSNLSHSIL